MTVRSTMKSYCKIASPAYGTEMNIDFTDSLGTKFDCNYFSVDCRSAANNEDFGFFVAQPSGIYSTEAETLALIAGASGSAGAMSASGLGGVVGTADGSVEMSLNSNDKTQGIRLWNYIPGSVIADKKVTFIITYGNMKQANPKRDQDDTFYPPGS